MPDVSPEDVRRLGHKSAKEREFAKQHFMLVAKTSAQKAIELLLEVLESKRSNFFAVESAAVVG